MLSKNYYRSIACLNEMGAAWIKQCQSFSVLLPGLSHIRRKNGAINLNQQTLNLCNPVRLNELYSLLIKTWQLPYVDYSRWTTIQHEFLKKIEKFYDEPKGGESHAHNDNEIETKEV